MSPFKGFSLIETFVALCVLTILLTMTLPQLSDSYQNYRADTAIKQIQQSLLLARNHAISYGQHVTACPAGDDKCGDNWLNGIFIFTDNGTMLTKDENDSLIQLVTSFNSKDFISFNRNYIRFQPNGTSPGSNGTFRYCPNSKTSPYSKALVINISGRVRLSQQKSIDCLEVH